MVYRTPVPGETTTMSDVNRNAVLTVVLLWGKSTDGALEPDHTSLRPRAELVVRH
jgi:hypothetical protein